MTRPSNMLRGITPRSCVTDRSSSSGKFFSVIVSNIFFGLVWSGCATTVSERQEGQPVTEATGETKGKPSLAGKYYLDDVRIPDELNYKPNKSFIYETPKFKAGILHFTKCKMYFYKLQVYIILCLLYHIEI